MKTKNISSAGAVLLICLVALFFSSCSSGGKAGARKLFRVQKAGKWGFIDKQGKIVIEPKFDRAGDFSEGLAQVENFKDSSQKGTILMEDVNCGYIDETGKFAIEPKFHSGTSREYRFSEGIAVFPASWFKPDGENSLAAEKTVAVDKTGKTLFELDANHKAIDAFSDGRLLVKVKEPQENWEGTKGTKFKYGYVDKTGKFVIEPREMISAQPFSEGLASIYVFRNATKYDSSAYYGFIDTSGKTVIEAKYKESRSFHDGLAAVSETTGEYGFIDKDENWVGGKGYSTVSDFNEGVAIIPGYKSFQFRGKTNGDLYVRGDGTVLAQISEGLTIILDIKDKLQIIDKKGDVVAAVDESVPSSLSQNVDPEGFQGGLLQISDDKEIIYIDAAGKVVWREKTSV